MAVDDIADSAMNPLQGKVFNRPDPTGPGIDVYAGCKIDYSGRHVTAENFLRVLTGAGWGKVLKSTKDDHIFVNIVGHGASGLLAFPDSELHKHQLMEALKAMQERAMFRKLVFYLDSRESGSMFQHLNIPGVYAVSATSPTESSWSTYCPSEADGADMVNGVHLETCLGDLFSVSWMQDTDVEDSIEETLEAQLRHVAGRSTRSEVMAWGDLSLVSDSVGDYVGLTQGAKVSVGSPLDFSLEKASVKAETAPLAFTRAICKRTGWTKECKGRLQAVRVEHQAVRVAYRRMVHRAAQGEATLMQLLFEQQSEPTNPTCELPSHEALRTGSCASKFDANDAFALSMHQTIVNLCAAASSGIVNEDIPTLAASACNDDDIQQHPQSSSAFPQSARLDSTTLLPRNLLGDDAQPHDPVVV